MPVGESDAPPEIAVYDIGNDMAVAKLTSPRTASHLQLVRINGTWKIINALRVARNGEATSPRGRTTRAYHFLMKSDPYT